MKLLSIKLNNIFLSFIFLCFFTNGLSSQKIIKPKPAKRTEKEIYDKAVKHDIVPWLFVNKKLKDNFKQFTTFEEDVLDQAFKIYIIARDFRNFRIALLQKLHNAKSTKEIARIYRDLKTNPNYDEKNVTFDEEQLIEFENNNGDWIVMHSETDDYTGGNILFIISKGTEVLNLYKNTKIINQVEAFSKHPEYKKEYLAYRKKQTEMK